MPSSKRRKVVLRGKRFLNQYAFGTSYSFSFGRKGAMVPLADSDVKKIHYWFDHVWRAKERNGFPHIYLAAHMQVRGALYQSKMFVETIDDKNKLEPATFRTTTESTKEGFYDSLDRMLILMEEKVGMRWAVVKKVEFITFAPVKR
jgi:hypothetical protein